VAYTLGLSRVEPLRHHLLFERFLSRERGSIPDIDLDFGHARREEVIQYLYQTYGAAHVGMACTAQTYHTKSAVRDVGKVLGIPAAVREAIARRVRQRLDGSLGQAVVAVAGEAAFGSALRDTAAPGHPQWCRDSEMLRKNRSVCPAYHPLGASHSPKLLRHP
jgi:error-prone DNA polymerase